MRQIQGQMESELRIKSDLVRNQLQIMSEIQMQNPEQVIDMETLLNDIKEKGVNTSYLSLGKIGTVGVGGVAREKSSMKQRDW